MMKGWAVAILPPSPPAILPPRPRPSVVLVMIEDLLPLLPPFTETAVAPAAAAYGRACWVIPGNLTITLAAFQLWEGAPVALRVFAAASPASIRVGAARDAVGGRPRC